MSGFLQLIQKEIYRFCSIWVQTILGPLATALLYQLIFGSQLANVNTGINHIDYVTFLIPGLIMMQALLNSFGNSSSSIIQAKYAGNIIYLLMAPISALAIYGAYLISSIVRGIIVAVTVFLGIIWFSAIIHVSYLILIYFLIVGASITAGLGIIVGVLSEKFDQLAGFQSFIIVPLIYLSGIFLNPTHLSHIWQIITLFDPFFYIVDGFRYAFLQHSSNNIFIDSIFILIFSIIINIIGYYIIKSGVKLKK